MASEKHSLGGALLKGAIWGLAIAGVIGLALTIWATAPVLAAGTGLGAALGGIGIFAAKTGVAWWILALEGAGIGAVLGGIGHAISSAMSNAGRPLLDLQTQQHHAPQIHRRSQGIAQAPELDNPYFQAGRGAALAQTGDAKQATRTLN